MVDVEKVLKTLEMSEAIGERCLLTCDDCGNLNEHIGNLNQRIAELEAQQRWIPVSERLPEGRTVLVFKKDGSISIDTTYIDGGNYFWWESGQSKVTHWMPLPNPPEVNNVSIL